MDLAHDLGVQPGTLIRKVVTGHARDCGVVEFHLPDGLRHAPWLIPVEGVGFAGGDLAEITPAGALRTTDEECGFAGLPALVQVRAASLLAHRVEGGARDPFLHVLELGTGFCGGADPPGFGLDRGLCVAGLDPEQLSSFWCDSHGPHPTWGEWTR